MKIVFALLMVGFIFDLAAFVFTQYHISLFHFLKRILTSILQCIFYYLFILYFIFPNFKIEIVENTHDVTGFEILLIALPLIGLVIIQLLYARYMKRKYDVGTNSPEDKTTDEDSSYGLNESDNDGGTICPNEGEVDNEEKD